MRNTSPIASYTLHTIPEALEEGTIDDVLSYTASDYGVIPSSEQNAVKVTATVSSSFCCALSALACVVDEKASCAILGGMGILFAGAALQVCKGERTQVIKTIGISTLALFGTMTIAYQSCRLL